MIYSPMPNNNSGFTLIEVLITFIILSIGLLGLAGLQGTDMQSNHSAYLRSQAALLANDMADRMRSNMAGVTAGDYDNITGTPPAVPDCLTANGCTPAQLAQNDASQWNSTISNRLPLGQGRVNGNGNNAIFTIAILWQDPLNSSTSINCNGIAVPASLNCLAINIFL